MNVAILDYGAGNLHSLAKAIVRCGADVSIKQSVAGVEGADALILPGVGSFASAAGFLSPYRQRLRTLLEDGLPCLGICLGMQLLLDASDEGPGRGLSVIPGHVRMLSAKRIPQMGWNVIDDATDELYSAAPLTSAYFANSFVCAPQHEETVTSWATHEEDRFAASVRSGSTVGVQFHPEKSSMAGIAFIDAFLMEARR